MTDPSAQPPPRARMSLFSRKPDPCPGCECCSRTLCLYARALGITCETATDEPDLFPPGEGCPCGQVLAEEVPS